MIFITGCPRSGTSTVSGLLAENGINFGSNLRPSNKFNPKGYFEDLEMSRILRAFKNTDKITSDNIGYLNSLDAIKHPKLIHSIDKWLEVFPNYHIILTTRNKEATIASYIQYSAHPFFRITTDKIVARIEKARGVLANILEKYGDRILEVSFEAIQVDAEAETKRMCQFVGIDYISSNFYDASIPKHSNL